MHSRTVHVNGIVQGVGFRPHVARLARSLGCTGWVRNDTHGVTVLVQHDDEYTLDRFEEELVRCAPAASRITDIDSQPAQCDELADFTIEASEGDEHRSTLISPDLATCDACVEELFDPNDRRYHYPFINCTNCGPRFTIIDDLPYDRANTSMASFEMCERCAPEYADETNRRYHAQPNACFECGPRLWWMDAEQVEDATFDDGALMLEDPHLSREGSDEIIKLSVNHLEKGDILAIKGLGGWHLACNACDEDAVSLLRTRKHRPSKALAIMVRDVDAAREFAHVSDAEAELLRSVERPIVLLRKKDGARIAPNVVGDLAEIGIMLPATPLQHLLMHALDIPLVMTSGNRSGEPIVASDADAFEYLDDIADFFLGNNRAIVARYDDSVARILEPDGSLQMIRRARGFAPSPLFIPAAPQRPASQAMIFAAGSEQKATFAFMKGDQLFVSQHLGDLEHLGALRAWEEARDRYERLFDMKPDVIACDMHPEYLASKWARDYASEYAIPLVEVQHHHAHIASVLGENGLEEPVIGIALDGTGYGTDGTIWGGEILIATRKDFERFWHLPTFKLPGGASAIRHPARTAYAVLKAYDDMDDEFFGQFGFDNPRFESYLGTQTDIEIVDQMIEKGINSPDCSSAGRLFDATSALLGICTDPSYDGEAACLLESAAHRQDDDTSPLTARSFHEGFVNAIIKQALRAREATGLTKVALSGGCMANRILSSQLREKLESEGFEVLVNHDLPPNDGCISYGQAIVARARLEE